MGNRRLVVLFVGFAAVAVVLVLRLGQLQIVQTSQWREAAREFALRRDPIETNRGTIEDRKGRALAIDRPCYDLAIEYQAMNYDDRWLYWAAVDRMKAAGIDDRRERLRRLAATKAAIAEQIEKIPVAIAKLCGVPESDVLERFDEVRQRITALRQHLWSRRYDPQKDLDEAADGTLIDPARPAVWEETIAHTVVPNVSEQVAWYLDKHRDDYPGLRIQSSVRRDYPYGDVACHILGTMRAVNRDDVNREPFEQPELDDPDQGPGLSADDPDQGSGINGEDKGDLRGYLPGDDVGANGVERMAERVLRGTRGMRLLELGTGEVLGKRIEPRSGGDVKLTIDAELEKAILRKLQDPNGDLLTGEDGQKHNVALVVMDITNGDVLAMISTPTYDLNTYHQEVLKLIHDDVNMPLLNRAIQASYPPGSIAKPLVAAAALNEGVVTPDETITCNGHLYPNQPNILRCWIYVDYHATHGPLSMTSALEQSCDIYFYTMGQRLGLQRLTAYFERFGLGRETGIGLKEEQPGLMADASDVTDPEMQKAEAIQRGIGQGRLSVTPLQMAAAYAELLRNGSRIRPRIVLDQPIVAGQAWISEANEQTIRRGMEMVINGTRGTAHKALRSLRLPMGGKTGSATARRTVMGTDGKEHVAEGTDAWFVGYAPADNPRYVLVAVKEFGGEGGSAAVPVVKEAVLEMERMGYLPGVDLGTVNNDER